MRTVRYPQLPVFVGVSSLCLVVALIVYLAGGTTTPYPHLMYFPIMLAALMGEWPVTIGITILSALLMSVWVMPLNVEAGTLQTSFGWIFRAGMYLSVGVFLKTRLVHLQRHQDRLLNKTRQLTAFSQTTLNAILHLAETKDPESTGRHLDCLRSYAEVLMDELDITPEEQRYILNAIALHDIGKVAIPDSILLKEGRLTAEEYERMKSHVIIGSDILKEIEESVNPDEIEMKRLMQTAWELTRYHHERPDGNGYPEGHSLDSIPFAARLTALCDVYDALAHKRPYKEAFPHAECVRIITEERGKQFDPGIVDAFLCVEQSFERIAAMQKEAGR